MLRGRIDRLTSAGLFEGWAVDDAAPLRALDVAVVDGAGREIASGLANLYRSDAGETRRGSDFAAFRLRAAPPPPRDGAFALMTSARVSIAAAARPPFVQQAEPPMDCLEAVAAGDPTVLPDVGALGACAAWFDAYAAARGIEAFVRTAHLYMLGRPVEAQAFLALRHALAAGAMTPLGALGVFADSVEFRREPRPLAAPHADGFPFAIF